jgi:beta-1,4-N-acetylglucosaminyltransferase
MLKLLSETNLDKFKPRSYIVAETDMMSLKKVLDFENNSETPGTEYKVNKLLRSRHVGQSYFTSIFTTIMAIFYSIPLIFQIKPELLLVNGPGTCVPCCLIVFIFSRILFLLPKCKIVFIESICRVKTLSLTGKILYYLNMTDSFIVQWPELQNKYKRSIYLGRLV